MGRASLWMALAAVLLHAAAAERDEDESTGVLSVDDADMRTGAKAIGDRVRKSLQVHEASVDQLGPQEDWEETINKVLDNAFYIDDSTSKMFKAHMVKIFPGSQCTVRTHEPLRIGKCDKFSYPDEIGIYHINDEACAKEVESSRRALICELGDMTEDVCDDTKTLARTAEATEDKDVAISVLFNGMIAICNERPGCRTERKRKIEERVDDVAATFTEKLKPLLESAWGKEVKTSATEKLVKDDATKMDTSLYGIPIRAIDMEADVTDDEDRCSEPELQVLGGAHQCGKFALVSGINTYMEGELTTRLKAWYAKHIDSFCDLSPIENDLQKLLDGGLIRQSTLKELKAKCADGEVTWVFDPYYSIWPTRGAKVVELVLTSGDIPKAEEAKKELRRTLAARWWEINGPRTRPYQLSKKEIEDHFNVIEN